MIENFLQIFEINNDVVGIIKVIIALAGFIGLITKTVEFFSSLKKRQQLKMDLEILELSKKNSPEYAQVIEEKIKNNIYWIYEANSKGMQLWNFLYGSTLFISFGYWSIELLTYEPNFNPWAILTLIVSASGINIIFSNEENKKDKSEFYKIEFYNKNDIIIGISILLLGLILTLILIISYQKFSYWLLVGLLFIFAGMQTITKHIKLRKKS